MSFILDALRKSETERRRATAPVIATIPVGPARSAVPGWIWGVIVALAIAVVGLGGTVWSNMRAGGVLSPGSAAVPPALDSGARTATAEPAATPQADPTPGVRAGAAAALISPVPGAGLSATGAPPRDMTVEKPEPAIAAAGDGTAPAAGDRASSGADELPANFRAAPADLRPAAARPPAAALPTLAELIATGAAVPELRLELHVYHPDPASRWVYIDGSRYTEGRQTAAGPRLVEILPEGARMNYAGREFLLLPQ